MQQFRQLALWGAVAAGALFLAILAGRSDTGLQRAATTFASLGGTPTAPVRPALAPAQIAPSPPRPSDAEIAMRQLAQAVRGLNEDRDRILTRLTSVEHHIDDMTGSITKQIDAVKTAATAAAARNASSAAEWPSGESPPVPTAPMTIAAVAATAAPPPAPAPDTQSQADAESPDTPVASGPVAAPLAKPAPAVPPLPPDRIANELPVAYGADIAGAPSMKALHERWAALSKAYPQLFAGLTPLVTMRDNSKATKISLRLVVGPFASADQAEQLCVTLSAMRMACQPTMFDGVHLALR